MIETSDYFETPQRNERLQLLMHLVSNATNIPYLRAPQGAGKTRFARELAGRLAADYRVVWLVAGSSASTRDQLMRELGLTGAGDNWVAEVIEGSSPDRPLLFIVDDAERLQLAEIADLLDLVQAGARLLLVGTGELAQAGGEWDLHFVDLPPLSEGETRAFLEALGRLEPGEAGARMAIALHRASDGLPGLLLDALDTLPEELPDPANASGTDRRFPKGLVAIVVVLAGLLGATFYFQDDINALFEAGPIESTSESPSAAPRAEESDVLPPAFESAPALPESVAGVEENEQAEPGSQASPAEPPSIQPDLAEAPAAAPPAEPSPSARETADDTPDPVLDAIIEEAIKAAAQPPGDETASTSPSEAAAESPAAARVQPEPASSSSELPTHPGMPPVAGEKGAADVEAARASAATVPAESAPGSPPAVAASSERPPATAVRRAAAAKEGGTGGLAWLRGQPDSAYTLQLVGARDRHSIRRFVRRHHVEPPYAIFERDLNGRPWYSLVAGSYPNREAAIAARKQLPESIAGGGVWPRTFGSIREQMRDGD